MNILNFPTASCYSWLSRTKPLTVKYQTLYSVDEGVACETRIDLSLCCSISLNLKGTWETQNHQTFCVSLVLVSFTLIYRAACPFLVKHSTIITSEESLRDSKLPVTAGVPEDQGTGVSVWNLCLCHSHHSTQLATCATSYMCISIVSHFTVMFARGSYMCFVKL